MAHTSLSVDGRVAYLTLDRPDRANTMSSKTRREELIPALEDLRENDEVKIVVLEAAGDGVFSGGGDMKEVLEMDFTARKYKHRIANSWEELYWELKTLEKPTIAKVEGDILAGAANVVMFVDIVIAAEDARVGFPETNHGIYTASQVSRLPYYVGPRQAMYLLLTGDPVSAEKAVEMGLFTEAVPEDELDERVAEVIDALVDQHPLILEYMRDAVYASMEMNYPAAYNQVKAQSLKLHRNDPPMVPGIEAFAEKRAPPWQESTDE